LNFLRLPVLENLKTLKKSTPREEEEEEQEEKEM